MITEYNVRWGDQGREVLIYFGFVSRVIFIFIFFRGRREYMILYYLTFKRVICAIISRGACDK